MFYDDFFLIIGGGVWPDLKLEVQNLKSFENDANIENISMFVKCWLRKVPSEFC